MDYGRVSPSAELLDGVNLSLDVVRLTQDQALDAIKRALEGTAVEERAKLLAVLPRLDHWTAALLSTLKPTARE